MDFEQISYLFLSILDGALGLGRRQRRGGRGKSRGGRRKGWGGRRRGNMKIFNPGIRGRKGVRRRGRALITFHF
jgi:hypothetical protein